MKYFLFKIATRYAKFTVMLWMLFSVFEILNAKFTASTEALFPGYMGLGLGIFASITVMNTTRWPLIWRRMSESIQQFWLGMFVILLFNLAFNWLVYSLVLATLTKDETISKALEINSLDAAWFYILAYLYGLVATFDQKSQVANASLKPICLRMWLCIAGLTSSISVSRL